MYLLLFAAILFMNACSNRTEELQHIETLENTLIGNKENLNIDIGLFEARRTFMEEVLKAFVNDYKQSISLELGNQLSRFKALKKLYAKHIDVFHTNAKEQEELKAQLDNLRADVKNNAISREEFKGFLSTERRDIEALVASSKQVKKTLYEVEPEYSRISKNLQTILETLED